ncbi:MAG TPA: FUSC family protein [Aldersonia sp.]
MTSAPVPAPPPGPGGNPIRAVFAMRDVGRHWPYALRAAVSMGIPALIGWALGDLSAGLMATIGGFTALYGGGRPYLNRAAYLAGVALAFALTVGVGVLVGTWAWASVLVVTVIAAAATLVCQALAIGPPGAYMFTLAAGAGVGLGAEHLSAGHSALLVLGGGAVAWCVHMSGALVRPRGPERVVLRAAGDSVAAFLDAIGTPRQDAARHSAALALEQSWATLVSYQPVEPRAGGALAGLRLQARELHELFARAMTRAARGEPPEPGSAQRARDLGQAAGGSADPVTVPMGRPGPRTLVAQAARPGSPYFTVTVRVSLATLIAGAIGAVSGVDHAYWAMASAVLVLYQGFDFPRTVQRGIERLLGTVVGLVVAGALLAANPQGLWLVFVVMALQFTIEMLVARNYALAVVFITPIALVISSGGRAVDDVGHLLTTRAVDTVIGIGVGLAVYAATMRRTAVRRVPEAVAAVLDDVDRTLVALADGSATSVAARTARRDLQQQVIALERSYAADVGSSIRSRDTAEWLWPSVVATERVAYRTLAVCWGIERLGDTDAAREAARSLFGEHGLADLRAALSGAATGIRTNTAPTALPALPNFLVAEVESLHDSVARRPE